MTIDAIVQLVTALGVVPALFIWLFMAVMKEVKSDREASRQREEQLYNDAVERESRLMKHLERTNENHEKIAHALDRLEARIEKVEERLDFHMGGR